MTVLITLTTAGTDTGPFNLYSDTDGYVSAFETGVSKAALVAGYSSSLVPNGTTIIRVKSTGVCTNYIDIPLSTTTTSTSSTTTTSSSTTTTTTAPPPTTTTTTTVIECVQYVLDSNGAPASIEWFDCGGSPLTQTFNGQYTICTDGSGYTVTGGSVSVVSSGSCAS